MAVNVVNPQDLTGRQKAELEAKAAAERKDTAQRLSMVTAQAQAEKAGTIDLTTKESSDDEAISVAKPKKTLRVNTKLEQVTVGHGTSYDFEVGQKYKVDADLYDYLDERGFVWH